MKKALALTLLLSTSAFSQDENPGIPDVPDPYAIHTPKGNFIEQPVMNGEDVSIMYFQLTGKRVLLSNASRGVEINLVQPGPITNKEVVELIETQLMMEGFTLVETPGKPDQLRLLPLTGGVFSAKQGGIKVITDPEKIPYNDELISYAMRLSYIKPEEAVSIFQTVIGQFGPAASIAVVPNASAVLITDNALTVRSLIEIKNQIDIPSTNVSTKFIKIIFADAEAVATQLNELINDQSSGNNRGNAQQAQARIPGQQVPGQADNIPLKILSDTRTNRITLLGSSSKIAFAESLIQEIDKPSSGGSFLRRKLSFLPVSDFIPIAQQAIQATLDTSGNGGGNSARGNQNQNNNNSNNNTGDGQSRASLSGQDGSTSPESQLVGKTLIVADNISNSVIVKGPPHHIEIVENLINELDNKSEQIAITAVFGTYSSNDSSSFSSNAVALYDQLTGTPQVGGGTIPGLSGGDISNIFSSSSLANFASAALATGFNVGFANTDYGVFINALKQETNFEEVSRPTVFTTNNRSARISSGSRIAVPTGTIFDGGGTTSTNIEFIDVVLELEVRPLVNNEDEVTVDIALVKDALGGTRVIDNLQTQDIDTQELNTIVTVPNKSLIVLGGLYTTNNDQTDNRVPILGDIPLLGKLFSSDSDNVDLNELVIMIYPHVISNNNELNNYQDYYDERSYVGPHARDEFNRNEILEKFKSKHDGNNSNGNKSNFSSNSKKKLGPKTSHRR